MSRFPRVDTPRWKRTVAEALLAAGFDIAVLYSRATIVDQLRAGLREEGWGVVMRYLALRRGTTSAASTSAGKTLAVWAKERGVPVIRTRRLEDSRALDALRRFDPSLAVLVGADIAPAPFLAIPRIGTINPHYGLLPAYRGMNVTEWAVFNGDPVGVTIHLVDQGIDSGAILLRETIAPAADDTFAGLRAKHQAAAARLLVEAAIALRDGTAQPIPQTCAQGRQYYRMHPALRKVAEARLRDQAGVGSG